MSAPLVLAEPPPAVLIVRDALRSWEQLVGRLGDPERVTLRKPADTTDPWVWVRSAGGFGISAAHGAWSRLVQVEACASRDVDGEVPELFTERVAASIATYFETVGAGLYQGSTSWRAHHLDGPNDLTDTSRGGDAAVYKHAVRLDVRLHAAV